MPMSVPGACARFSLCLISGKLPLCYYKNKHLALRDGLPCKNKHSSSASLLGTPAGAHTGSGATSSAVGTLAGNTAAPPSTSCCVSQAHWAQNHLLTPGPTSHIAHLAAQTTAMLLLRLIHRRKAAAKHTNSISRASTAGEGEGWQHLSGGSTGWEIKRDEEIES